MKSKKANFCLILFTYYLMIEYFKKNWKIILENSLEENWALEFRRLKQTTFLSLLNLMFLLFSYFTNVTKHKFCHFCLVYF